MKITRRKAKSPKRGFLDGKMLIAMPGMRDERFVRTVIYVCAHSDEGAMGIIVNKTAPDLDFPKLLVKLNVIPAEERIQLPPDARELTVLRGGPVETQRGFVLHSSDYYMENSTLPIDDGVCLTATLDVLKAIATGSGPAKAIMALGYAGWAPGQLETEMRDNGWLHCGADKELIFSADVGGKYDKALQMIGVHPGMLSSEAGHA